VGLGAFHDGEERGDGVGVKGDGEVAKPAPVCSLGQGRKFPDRPLNRTGQVDLALADVEGVVPEPGPGFDPS